MIVPVPVGAGPNKARPSFHQITFVIFKMVSPNPPINMKNETITSETIKGERQLIVNYLKPIVQFGQSRACVRLCSAFCQQHHRVHKCWLKSHITASGRYQYQCRCCFIVGSKEPNGGVICKLWDLKIMPS